MEYTTVYDLAQQKSLPPETLLLFVGVLVFVLSTGMIIRLIKKNGFLIHKAKQEKRQWLHSNKQLWLLLPFLLASVFFITISSISIINRLEQRNSLLAEITSSNIKLIEGPVQNFSTPSGGHAPEEFTVGETWFRYYDDDVASYCKTKENGGFIKGNNQKLRITYVEEEENNFIVKLEIESTQ